MKPQWCARRENPGARMAVVAFPGTKRYRNPFPEIAPQAISPVRQIGVSPVTSRSTSMKARSGLDSGNGQSHVPNDL